jgi:hypothetical protein
MLHGVALLDGLMEVLIDCRSHSMYWFVVFCEVLNATVSFDWQTGTTFVVEL